MTGSVLLCVLIFAGSVSVCNGWMFHRKDRTECGSYNSQIPFSWKPQVKIDNVLNSIKSFDGNRDGFVTLTESNNVQRYNELGLTFDTGIPRCIYVSYLMKTAGLEKETANYVFTLLDSDKNQLLSAADDDEAGWLFNDANGDKQVSVCELYRSILDLYALAEKKAYDHVVRQSDTYEYEQSALCYQQGTVV